jgi:hypothetical protein
MPDTLGKLACGEDGGLEKEGVAYYANSRTGQQMPLYYQLKEDYQRNVNRFDVMNAITELEIPLLICHGTNDEAVPVTVAHELFQASRNARLTLLLQIMYLEKTPLEGKLFTTGHPGNRVSYYSFFSRTSQLLLFLMAHNWCLIVKNVWIPIKKIIRKHRT